MLRGAICTIRSVLGVLFDIQLCSELHIWPRGDPRQKQQTYYGNEKTTFWLGTAVTVKVRYRLTLVHPDGVTDRDFDAVNNSVTYDRGAFFLFFYLGSLIPLHRSSGIHTCTWKVGLPRDRKGNSLRRSVRKVGCAYTGSRTEDR